MQILLERENDRFSIESVEFGQYDEKSNNTSKFNSEAYFKRGSTLWSELEGSFPRSVMAVSKNNDLSKSFETHFIAEFKKSIKQYMGSHKYVRIDDVVVVETKTFDHLLSLQHAFDEEIDNLVEEIALERSADILKYDLSTVMNKLEFDEGDLQEIQKLIRDGEF